MTARPLPLDAKGWAKVEQYGIRERCVNCGVADPNVSVLEPDKFPPERDDLQAAFAVGYNSIGLHIRLKVFDDDFFIESNETTEVNPRPIDTRQQDHIELVYRGLISSSGSPGADDGHLYVNYLGEPKSRDERNFSEILSWDGEETTAGRCRISVLTLSPAFLAGTTTSQPNQGYEPKLGGILFFNIGLSDFDIANSNKNAGPVRQHHVFHKPLADGYWFRPKGHSCVTDCGLPDADIGTIILGGPSPDLTEGL